jgi:hypothetical protein
MTQKIMLHVKWRQLLPARVHIFIIRNKTIYICINALRRIAHDHVVKSRQSLQSIPMTIKVAKFRIGHSSI